jgi:hypothetical protein
MSDQIASETERRELLWQNVRKQIKRQQVRDQAAMGVSSPAGKSATKSLSLNSPTVSAVSTVLQSGQRDTDFDKELKYYREQHEVGSC